MAAKVLFSAMQRGTSALNLLARISRFLLIPAPRFKSTSVNLVRRIVLECFEICSAHKEFYENQAAVMAVQTMLRLSYCINKSLKDSTLFEKLVQGVSDILVRYIFLIVVYYENVTQSLDRLFSYIVIIPLIIVCNI